MKITWLGQAGLLFETEGKRIVIDPYLSDNVKNYEPENFRRVAVDGRFLSLSPDVVICTHNHLDHFDPVTMKEYLGRGDVSLFLAPRGAWEAGRAFGGRTNYVLFNEGTTWTEGGISLRAVCAEHSDPHAIGVILSAEGKHYYVTGDTLYSERVFRSLPDLKLHAVFLPINGKGNNMNATDASRFAARTGARYAVPMHFGMFDTLSPEGFTHEGRVIPEIYKEVVLKV